MSRPGSGDGEGRGERASHGSASADGRPGDWSVAVLVVNWNSWGLLRRCLAALVAQTQRPTRTLVVDNGSSEPMPAGFDLEFPAVEFKALASNRGFAAANNVAIAMCRDCRWIALLNPDAFPEPAWLASLTRAASEHSRASFFASRLLMTQLDDTLDGDGDGYHASGFAWRLARGRAPSGDLTVREVFGACAAAALYSRSALEEVGGFDEDFFCYQEDVDLSFRLRLAGHRCVLVPAARVRHVGAGTVHGLPGDFALYHGHRNLVWTFAKNMPGVLFWLFLPLQIGLTLISLVWFGAQGRGWTLCRAKWDALVGLPGVLRKRARVQRDRKATVVDILRVVHLGPVLRR